MSGLLAAGWRPTACWRREGDRMFQVKRAWRAVGWFLLGYMIGSYVVADYDLKREATARG